MTYAWPPSNFSEKWVPGQYRITFSADIAKQVPESNEANNTSHLMFTVPSGMNMQKAKDMAALRNKPAQAISFAIKVQSPQEGSEHEAGQPLPIQWNKGLISTYPTVNIQLVDAQGGAQVNEMIKSGAPNSGQYNSWIASPIYVSPGIYFRIRIVTPDNKISGQSGVFSFAAAKEKQRLPFLLEATITNSNAYARGGDLSPGDCLSAPSTPQPIYDFYPGTFLKNFSLFGESETAKIDLLDQVKDWTAGQANHGLMLRGPVNRANYLPSACVKYYHSFLLVTWYLE